MNVAGILKAKGLPAQTIDRGATVADAVRRMAGPPRIGALVVCDPDGPVQGLITERDVTRAVGTHGSRLLEVLVTDVMSRNVPVCAPEDGMAQLMAVMTRSRYRHLPVVAAGRLVGLVSIGDVVKHRLEEIEMQTGVLRDLYIVSR